MSDRILRINEAMRQVLGSAVGELSDPRVGFITITTVRVARDMRNAKVYFSVLGPQSSRADTLAALNSAHGLLQRAVAREVKIHHTPQLEFIYDDTIDTVQRLDALLRDGDDASASDSAASDKETSS